jgi:dUTPase
MTLLAGVNLDKNRFFSSGDPDRQASSFDLKIGSIYDEKGNRVEGQYMLRPNEMIQVVSEEVFNLPNDITAHVSYRTRLTSKGIWALTVGIVDPGWNCPISTTLFNFSKVDFAVLEGNVFLRVSFFEHEPVDQDQMRPSPTAPAEYHRSVQATAGSRFSKQFLDVEKVSNDAGEKAVKRMQQKALTWVACIAGLFTVIQLVLTWAPPAAVWYFDRSETNAELASQIRHLEEQLRDIRGLLDVSQ